jgi:hypothetical protein
VSVVAITSPQARTRRAVTIAVLVRRPANHEISAPTSTTTRTSGAYGVRLGKGPVERLGALILSHKAMSNADATLDILVQMIGR